MKKKKLDIPDRLKQIQDIITSRRDVLEKEGMAASEQVEWLSQSLEIVDREINDLLSEVEHEK